MMSKGVRAWAREDVGQMPVGTREVMVQLQGLCMIALLAYTFFLVAFPNYGELKIGGSPNIAPSRLLRFMMLGLMMLIMLIKPHRLKLTRQDEPAALWVFRLSAAFWIWTLLMVLFNVDNFAYTFSELKNKVLPVWIGFWMTAAMIRQPRTAIWVVRLLGGATLLVLGVVALEVVLKRNVFDGLLQVENISTALAFADQSRDGYYRAKGTFQHPLTLAHYLVSFGLLFTAKGIFDTRFKRGIIWTMLGAVTLASVYFTHTRSGLALGGSMLLLLLGIRYALWLKTMRNRVVATLLGVQLLWLPVLMFIAWIVLFQLVEGRTSEEYFSTMARVQVLQNAVPAILGNPVFGYGVGLGAKEAGVEAAGISRFVIDNVWLLNALESGLPAAILLGACMSLAAWRLWPRWRDIRTGEDIGLRIGCSMVLLASLAMYNIYALTELFELLFVFIAATLCIPGRYANRFARQQPPQQV